MPDLFRNYSVGFLTRQLECLPMLFPMSKWSGTARNFQYKIVGSVEQKLAVNFPMNLVVDHTILFTTNISNKSNGRTNANILYLRSLKTDFTKLHKM